MRIGDVAIINLDGRYRPRPLRAKRTGERPSRLGVGNREIRRYG